MGSRDHIVKTHNPYTFPTYSVMRKNSLDSEGEKGYRVISGHYSEKEAREKAKELNYGKGHDMKAHGEGKPYGET